MPVHTESIKAIEPRFALNVKFGKLTHDATLRVCKPRGFELRRVRASSFGGVPAEPLERFGRCDDVGA